MAALDQSWAPADATLAGLMSDLEQLWQALDTAFAGLDARAWRTRHGAKWQLSDVPWHMAYFDREVVAEGIARGGAMAGSGCLPMQTLAEFAAWNERHFAARPPQLDVGSAVEAMRASRAAIRAATAQLTEEDLSRPVWIALTGYGGWRSVRFVLALARMHTWSHLTQVRQHLRLATADPGPAVTRAAVDGYLRSLPVLWSTGPVEGPPVTVAVRLTGPGGGHWAVQLSEQGCRVGAELPAAAEVEISSSPELLVALLADIVSPPAALLRGDLRIRGWRHVPRIARLLRRPSPDRVLAPLP
jgi:hypothetical protein